MPWYWPNWQYWKPNPYHFSSSFSTGPSRWIVLTSHYACPRFCSPTPVRPRQPRPSMSAPCDSPRATSGSSSSYYQYPSWNCVSWWKSSWESKSSHSPESPRSLVHLLAFARWRCLCLCSLKALIATVRSDYCAALSGDCWARRRPSWLSDFSTDSSCSFVSLFSNSCM